jgi:RND family efflux transporter MFP subunit
VEQPVNARKSRKARPYRIALWLAIVALAGAGAWYVTSRPVAVSAANPTRGPAVEAVYATGAVEPVYWAKVASTLVGRIAEIPVKEGDTVKTGDVLMKLDDREAKAKLAEAEARERFLATEVTRMTALAQRDFASQQAYQKVVSEYSAAVAAATAARQRLADLTLTAPLDGEVLRLDGNIGEVVRSGDALVWVGHCCPMRIEADVDEEDIPKVRKGQTVLVKADAWPDRAFKAQVASVTPKGDPVSKNYRVRMTLDPDQPLRIGMTAEVNIVVREEKNALLVPFTAIRGDYVFVVEAGAARKRQVRTGIAGAQRIQIVEGIGDGDLVIGDPPATLKDGDAVALRPAASGNANAKK